MKTTTSNLMMTSISLLSGTALGIGAGLLLAPQSGARTRRQLRHVYEDAKENIETRTKDLTEVVGRKVKKSGSLLASWLEKIRPAETPGTPSLAVVREGVPMVFRRSNLK